MSELANSRLMLLPLLNVVELRDEASVVTRDCLLKLERTPEGFSLVGDGIRACPLLATVEMLGIFKV